MATETLELRSPEVQAPGARSAVYKALARAFRSPRPSLWQELESGQLAGALGDAAAALPYELAFGGELTLAPGVGLLQLENAYLALFEVGGSHGSPCYLHEGEHGGGRMAVLDEVLRFYHYFGLRLNEERRDRPDHLATELEFMHALTFHEAAAQASAGDPAPLRGAQRDFLRLHLEPFIDAIGSKLAGSQEPLYPGLSAWAGRFCRAELGHLAGSR